MGNQRNEGAVRIAQQKVRLLGTEMKFKDTNETAIKVGTDNPCSVAQNMPAGSIYYDVTNKRAFQKMDAGTTTNFRLLSVSEFTKDPTGFVDNTAIGVSYSVTTREVTLTHASGTVSFLLNGRLFSYASPWIVPTVLGGATAITHADEYGSYFLKINPVTYAITFDTTPWTFDQLMICFAFKNATAQFALRECHGLMPWNSHEENHSVNGTFLKSAISMTTGTAFTATTAATATTASNCPGVEAGTIYDEDIPTLNSAWPEASYTTDTYNSGTYTTLYIGTAGAAVFSTTAQLPYITAGGGVGVIQYAPVTSGSGALTNVTEDSYVNVLVLSLPVTSDVDSQKYRTVFVTGQQQFTTLAAAQVQDPASWFYGEIANSVPEYVAIQMYSYQYNASNPGATPATVLGRAFLAALPVTFTGSRARLTGFTGVAPSDHATLSGRSAASQHPSTAISTDTTWGGTANLLTGSETDVQLALSKLQLFATASIGGVVSATTQTFAGLKTFQDGISLGAAAIAFGADGTAADNKLVRTATGVLNWNNGNAIFGTSAITLAQPTTLGDSSVANTVKGRHTLYGSGINLKPLCTSVGGGGQALADLCLLAYSDRAGNTAWEIGITENSFSGTEADPAWYFYSYGGGGYCGGISPTGAWALGGSDATQLHYVYGRRLYISTESAATSNSNTVFLYKRLGQSTDLGTCFAIDQTVLKSDSEDTGTVPIMQFAISKPTAGTIATRPVYAFYNHTTLVSQCSAAGAWALGPTSGTAHATLLHTTYGQRLAVINNNSSTPTYAAISISTGASGGDTRLWWDTAGTSSLWVAGVDKDSNTTWKLACNANADFESNVFMSATNAGAWTFGETKSAALNTSLNLMNGKLKIGATLGASATATAPTTIAGAYYLGLGGLEHGPNSYRVIGFGYKSAGTNHYPAFIGYKETSSSSETQGQLIFATRSVVTDTEPTICGVADTDGAWTLGASGGTALHVLNTAALTTSTAAGISYLRITINGATRRIPTYNDA